MKIASAPHRIPSLLEPRAPTVPARVAAVERAVAERLAPAEADAGSFARAALEAVEAVSRQQADAGKMVIDLSTGRDVNVHNAVLAMEEAGLAFRFMVQVRNKALEAYQEVMRMQV